MNNKHKYLRLWFVAAVSFMAACSTTNPIKPHNQTVVVNGIKTTMMVGESTLAQNVRLKEPKFRKVGLLAQGSIDIENLTEQNFGLEYLAEWYDKDGFKIESIQQWQPFELSPSSTRTISTVGKDPEVAAVTVQVRQLQ